MKNISILFMLLLFVVTGNAQIYTSGTTADLTKVSSAINEGTTATGHSSFAAGYYTTASGDYSVAMGTTSLAEGSRSFAFGGGAKALSDNGIAFGRYVQTNGNTSYVIGRGYNSSNYLQNSIPYSFMVGFKSDIPTLYVGTSNGVGTTGNVGIGTTTPSQLLDVNGTLNVADAATFGDDLNVNGKTTTTQLQLTSGAATGKILQCDAAGNASWENVEDVVPESVWGENSGNAYYLDGNVGIGTAGPEAQLELVDFGVAGSMNLKIGNDIYLSDIDQGNTLGIYGYQNNHIGNIKLGSTGPKLYGKNGKLGIGTPNPTATLDVNGILKANTIEVDVFTASTMSIDSLNIPGKITTGELEVKNMKGWQDQVFDKEYSLASLSSVEKYIQEHHHLENIPSEAEILANGYNVGEMDALLLQKIEELTLYIIELEKKIEIAK